MYTKDTYQMIGKYFNTPEEEHCFVGKFPDDENYAGNYCRVFQSRSPQMLRALYESDYIIVHGLLNKLVVILLALQPWLLKKCCWIVWGGDIYIHEKANKSAMEKLVERMKRFIIPRIPYVATLVDADYGLAQKWYGAAGKQLPIIYPVPSSNQSLMESLPKTKHQGLDGISILLGNSATETNQHFQALDWLARFRDENIRVYLPLSYGSGDFHAYAQKVIDYAVELFGDKVYPVTEQMSGDDYLRFLNDMDVGLFNNNRQQAMGNISQLILCGAKVYIRTDTKMWGHFRSLGCSLHDIGELAGMERLEELTEEPADTKAANQAVIAKRHDMRFKVEQWESLLNTLRQGKDKETNG